ncbi:MAG: ATP-binding protein, partial [Acidobacteriota bacterium]
MQKEEMTRAFMRSAKLASIGELATGLAHEINNPLAIISAEQTNISDLLWEPEATPDWKKQVQESVKRCKAQVQRCANITSKMLLFGRKQESRLELTDIVPRLEETVNLLERHARVRNIKISLDTAAHLPRVMVDPVEFEQVLVNLLNNAIDAMPQGGEIVIRAYPKQNSLMMDVADQGVGIPPDRLERVFEPFYTTKPAGQGTGLGLSVCYGMVHSWGGRISADSTVGEGTTVTVKLPLPQN